MSASSTPTSTSSTTRRSGASTTSPLRADPPRLRSLGRPVDLLALATDRRLRCAALLTVRGWRVLVGDPTAELTDLQALDRYAAAAGWREERDPALPPFTGGAVGHITDDVTAGLLDLAPDPRPPAAVEPVRFGLHDWVVTVSPAGETWVAAPVDRIDEITAFARTAATPGEAAPPPRAAARPSLDRPSHRRAVETILEWIAAGDLYQLNLTLQLSLPWRRPASALATRMLAASPGAAHAAWLTQPDGSSIVSVSPETFLRVDGDTVTTRPIKGTRPRAADPATDRGLGETLRGSSKDHAEHVMIVDLERNDLGRACVDGSVVVDEMAALEPHPTVWHLTSTVHGTLRSDVGLAELLAATFPSGSVTGAPKRMSVTRTRLLEPVRRGVYCGAIGAIGPGLVDLSVAIRTAVVSHGVASYGAGGGIVADSRPDSEWLEAMDKAAAFLRAANAAPPG